MVRYPAVPSAASLLDRIVFTLDRDTTRTVLGLLGFETMPAYGALADALQRASLPTRCAVKAALDAAPANLPPHPSPLSGDWRSPTQKAADALLAAGLPLTAK
jgi:hypothetical protein